MSRQQRRSGRTTAEGYATVLAGSLAIAVVTVGHVALLGAMAVARQHQVDAAADLAALAAAQSLQTGSDPCRAAGSVAAGNGGRLTTCDVDGVDVLVRVSRETHLAGLRLTLSATARAGPT